MSALDEYQSMDDAFPNLDPGVLPLGHRVLVQIRTPATKSKGGIIIVADAVDVEKWNTTVAKVRAIGPLAFKKRDSLEPWPEGAWASVGDYVRVPKFGGDRWAVKIPGKGGDDEALFVIFNDHELIGHVTVDPRTIKAFV